MEQIEWKQLSDSVHRVVLISHCVVRVLLLQLLRHVGDGGNGRLQVGRKDQTEAVGVREPMELHCTLTP